jgi:ribosomal protein S28E/S33
VLDGTPPLGHQGEAAFSLVAQGSQERVAGFRIDIELAAGWLFHRDVHARAGPFINRTGEDGQVFQVRPGFRQDEFAGRGYARNARFTLAVGSGTGAVARWL